MAYDFTAASTQYLFANPLPLSTPLTLACWFNSKSSQVGVLLSLANDSSKNLFALYKDSSNLLHAYSERPGLGAQSSISGILNGQWMHGAATFSSNTSRSVYLNNSIGSSSITNISVTGASSLYIGADITSGNIVALANSLIAEVGIWNAALTAAEIASLAKGMTCDKIRPQNLVFYAPLVRDLIDAKGGLVITNNNGATVANHPRIYP